MTRNSRNSAPGRIPPPAKQEGGACASGVMKKAAPGKPLVTIITSTYNAAAHLPNVIKSVREQTYANLEWIVVDGASKDRSIDILRENEDVIDHWIAEPDQGIYDAWNKGLLLAHGDWVCFLGADDQLFPDAIESMVNVAGESPEPLDLVSGKVQLCSRGVPRRTIGKPWTWGRFRKYMSVAHVGSMHNMAYFKRYGGFDVGFRIAGDYELLLRAGPRLKAGFVDKVLAKMEVGGVSNQNTAVFRETLNARLKHGATSRLAGIVSLVLAWFKWKVRRSIKY